VMHRRRVDQIHALLAIVINLNRYISKRTITQIKILRHDQTPQLRTVIDLRKDGLLSSANLFLDLILELLARKRCPRNHFLVYDETRDFEQPCARHDQHRKNRDPENPGSRHFSYDEAIDPPHAASAGESLSSRSESCALSSLLSPLSCSSSCSKSCPR